MSREPQEWLDAHTGIRLTVEYDIPESPKLTAFFPEGCTLEVEEVNEAIRRLLTSAGFPPQKEALP